MANGTIAYQATGGVSIDRTLTLKEVAPLNGLWRRLTWGDNFASTLTSSALMRQTTHTSDTGHPRAANSRSCLPSKQRPMLKKLALLGPVALVVAVSCSDPSSPTTALSVVPSPLLNVSTQAASVDKVKFPVDQNFGVVGTCSGFDIIRHDAGVITLTTFYSADGEPRRLQIHWRLAHTWTNSVTGKSVTTPSVGNAVLDFETGHFGVAGSPFRLTIPREGIVIKDAGLIIFDAEGNKIFEAGRHDFGPNGDPTMLCPWLQ